VAAACRRKGLQVAALLAELEREVRPLPSAERPDQQPTDDLIHHIVEHYHAAHRAELPRLRRMAERVEQVHAGRPDCPHGLAAHLARLTEELEEHMQKEEQVLFPMAVAGKGAFLGPPVAVLTEEHDGHGRSLQQTRALAHDLVPPSGACGTWRALYLGLAEFERDVMQHIHLENHVLFPRLGAG
jgi:regulator of cell morphogenesis and NO signaling